jgi:hypothetical protein
MSFVYYAATQVKRKAWAGEYQMLYITPELATNNTAALQQLHATRRIGLIAIDEAHCVSEWWVLQAGGEAYSCTAALAPDGLDMALLQFVFCKLI